MAIKSIKPSIPRLWLFMLAGLVWSFVGVMLCSLAVQWVRSFSLPAEFFLEILGFLLALVITRWGFSQIVRQNIHRLKAMNESACLFAFIPWKSYLIILVMMSLGIFLRHSAIPRLYLVILYTGIGGALFLSSFGYYRSFWQMKKIYSSERSGLAV